VDWTRKRVFITGASSGIGRALALELARRGAALGLIARSAPPLEVLCEELRAAGARAEFAPADVCDASAVAAACARLSASLGPCDVLVANAGIHRYTPGRRLRALVANEVIATNVLGVINAVAAVTPEMVERRAGRLVAVASIAAKLGLPGVAAYSASKAAVVTLMRSLAVDLFDYGIRVTTVCPGFVDTPMLRDHSRRALKWVLTAPQAAERIVRAIETDRREAWFPWQTWALATLAGCLPFELYRRVFRQSPGIPDGASRDCSDAPTEAGEG